MHPYLVLLSTTSPKSITEAEEVLRSRKFKSFDDATWLKYLVAAKEHGRPEDIVVAMKALNIIVHEHVDVLLSVGSSPREILEVDWVEATSTPILDILLSGITAGVLSEDDAAALNPLTTRVVQEEFDGFDHSVWDRISNCFSDKREFFRTVLSGLSRGAHRQEHVVSLAKLAGANGSKAPAGLVNDLHVLFAVSLTISERATAELVAYLLLGATDFTNEEVN